MLHARRILHGAAILFPAVLLAVALSAPSVDVPTLPVSRVSGAVLMLLIPLAIVLIGIASFVVFLWRKSTKPLPPHQLFLAALSEEEWKREFQAKPIKR